MAFLQLLKVQSEYAEMTFDPDPRNAPPCALLTLNPNTVPSVESESAAQSQLNTHQQTTFIQPTDDWTEPVMSQGSFRVESVVMETEIRSEEMPLSKLTRTDRSVSDCGVAVTLPGKYSEWAETVRSHGSFKAESVVMETEKDTTLPVSVLTENLVLEVTSENLAPSSVTSDPLSPDLTSPLPVPPTGSCQNAEQTSQHHPENIHSQAGDTAVAEPQLAVSTAALISLILWLCSNAAF